MTDAKQSHLNGAYYGPPAPPPHSYYSAGRRSGCGLCFCTLFKFIVSLVIILGIAALVLWLVLRPNEIKAYVGAASLTQFAFSNSSNNLQYNLTLDLSVRNPNRRIGIYYDRVEAQALYGGARFGFDDLDPFYQGHKTTVVLRPEFKGTQRLLGDDASAVATTYERETGEGYYYVDVKLRSKLRVKIWIFKIHYDKQKIDCTLKLPVPGSSGSFEGTKCDVDYF